MNTWDQRWFASCEAAQEVEDAIDDGQSEKKLSFREIIFNAEGKYRPPFSERSAVSSIFAVGTTTVNGRTRDVAAYEDSPVYVDAHAKKALPPFPRPARGRGLRPAALPRRSRRTSRRRKRPRAKPTPAQAGYRSRGRRPAPGRADARRRIARWRPGQAQRLGARA